MTRSALPGRRGLHARVAVSPLWRRTASAQAPQPRAYLGIGDRGRDLLHPGEPAPGDDGNLVRQTDFVNTIFSGVAYFITHGDWPLALVIFTASIFVPLMKISILIFLLISVHRRSSWRPVERTRMYRLTELIGRWSMVDIYVITILVALVRLGNLATIEASAGAVFFGAVVVITILAAESFDPRIIWDRIRTDTP